MQPEKPVNIIRFDEDSFDLDKIKKKATSARERDKNIRFKRTRRLLFIGRLSLAIAAFLIFFLLYMIIVYFI